MKDNGLDIITNESQNITLSAMINADSSFLKLYPDLASDSILEGDLKINSGSSIKLFYLYNDSYSYNKSLGIDAIANTKDTYYITDDIIHDISNDTVSVMPTNTIKQNLNNIKIDIVQSIQASITYKAIITAYIASIQSTYDYILSVSASIKSKMEDLFAKKKEEIIKNAELVIKPLEEVQSTQLNTTKPSSGGGGNFIEDAFDSIL